MAFPPSSLSAPSLSAFQMYFNGVTFGPAPFRLRGADGKGLDGVRGMPGVRAGDAGRPRDQGEFAGLNVLPGRTVTITIDVGPPFGSYSNLKTAMTALATALVPAGTTQYPLYYSEDGTTTYVGYARCLMSTAEVNNVYALGNLAQGISMAFKLLDPRWYVAPTQTVTIGLLGSGGGLVFPLIFPIDFNANITGSPDTAQITNLGNIDTRPLLTITGPCTNPIVANTSTVGDPYIGFTVKMATGDTLVIDLDMHSAVYTPYQAATGYSVLSQLATGSTWWTLPAGATNTIAFGSSDAGVPAGTCTIQWASAYLL